MANNPLDFKEFKHYLNFKSDDTGRIQISEPVKFDGAEFVIEQDSNGYARDISYMSEEIDLEFYEGFWEKGDSNYQLPNGVVVDQLGHAIEYLFEYNRDYGFQSQIEYILERNGIEFIIGELNFEGATTDELTYFNCKVVQNTKRALSKRREDTKVNGFAIEDLDGNTIEPIETVNMLLRAKPVVQESEWQQPSESTFFHPFSSGGSGKIYYNSANNVISSRIDRTLSFLRLYTSNEDNISNASYIDAKLDLTNIVLSVNFNAVFSKLSGTFANPIGSGVSLIYRVISDIENPISSTIKTGSLFFETISESSPINTFGGNYTLTDLDIPNGSRLLIYLEQETAFLGGGNTSLVVSQFNINITATATSIDTVVKAVRYGDLARYSLKAINGMDIISPDFDEGGKFYDLFAFSGNLIRQRDDVPFYFDFKDRRENWQNLACGDIQVNENDAFALRYDKFYDNVDNGGFSTIPNTTFEMSFNQRYAINLLEFKFKTYESDRDESNTLDSVHTEAQFLVNNDKVKNTKKIEVNDVFDPFSIESIRSQQFKETTALEGDDKIHCMDAIPLAPTARGGFTASMTHNINEEGNLELLKDAELPSWSLVGVEIGSPFKIESGLNIGDYEVFEIQDTIITLSPSPTIPTEQNVSLTTVSYPFTNVGYVNRTNEGFDLIENVLSPNNYGNLKYTIRRNLIDWESYISTSTSFINENPKNTEFKNNGLLVTQFEGGEIYTENADINLDTIQKAILSPRIYETDVIAEYDTVLDLISKYQNIDTVGGFIRVEGNNGDVKQIYPKKLGYTWATKVLNIVGEHRIEADVITINKSGEVITINEVGYTQDQLNDIMYERNGEFFAIYDENKIKITNFTKYNKFIVQEETFDDPNELAQALIDL